MTSRRSRVAALVGECQRFAGVSSLATTRAAQAALLREFVLRLPDGRDSEEEVVFRGILLEVAIGWATQVHNQFHKTHPGPCELTPIHEVWTRWSDRTAGSKTAFVRSAEAFLTIFDRTHPLCPAEKAKDIIDSRYYESLDLQELERMTGCHFARLRTSFKQMFGVSLREYRTRTRVMHAARLAQSSDLKIDAIAAAVGFTSRRHFYNAFRRVTGCTPRELRTPTAEAV